MNEPGDQGDERPGASGGDDEPGRAERLTRVVEKLIERLDVAAAFVVDQVAESVLDPLRQVRRVFWVAAALLLFLGVFALAAPAAFMVALPYILGSFFILTALALMFLDRRAGMAEARIQALVDKAEKWRKVGRWAREFL